MNSYSYNSISLKKQKKVEPTPTANSMITSQFYNTIGKFLGIDTHTEWNQYYDKVYQIANWAKDKAKSNNTDKVIQFLYTKTQKTPQMSTRRINDLYVMSKLSSEPKPAPQVRAVVKEVEKVEKPEPKEDTEQFVNNWLKETLGGIT